MAETFKHLAQGQVVHTGNAAAQELYEAPAGTTAIVGHIRLANTNAAARTVQLYQNGVAATNVILPTLSIEGGGWAEFTGSIILDAGDILYGIANTDSTSISYNIYGLEVT
jgi:hypothetical protein